MSEKEITIEIKNPEVLILIILLTAVFAMEIYVTLNTPISFGDEGFHTRMSQWIGEHAEYPVMNELEGSDIQRLTYDRPPLWNLLEGSFVFLFGFYEPFIKIFTPLIAALSGFGLFLFVKKIYNEKVALMAAMIFITIPSFVTYSIFFYTDVLFTFYFLMFVFTFVYSIKANKKKYWLLSAAFGGLAVLSKTPGVAVYVFAVFVFLYQLIRGGGFLSLFKKYTILIVFMLVVCSGFFIRSFHYYGMPHVGLVGLPIPFFEYTGGIDEFEEEYEFAGRTETAGTEAGVLAMGVLNYLNFAYGNVWVIVFGFLGGLSLFFMRRGDTDVILFLASITILFILYRSLSRAEDTARFTLGWTPLVATIVAIYFGAAYDFIKRYQKYLALMVFIFVIVYSLFGLRFLDIRGTGKYRGYGIIDKLFGYNIQQNGGTTHFSGLSDVKQFSPLFFESCDWVKEALPKDSVLFTVWSHRAVYNCQRDVVGNLADISVSRDLNHTLSVAKQHGITHIFIQKFSIDYQNQHLQERYDWDFVQFMEDAPEHFEIVHQNGPGLDECRQAGSCDGNIIYEIKY